MVRLGIRNSEFEIRNLKRLIPPLPPLEGPAWREFTLLGALLLAVFLACYQPLWDPDTYWHLAVGRQIWETGHLVRTETFSFTAPGVPWEDTEWLFHALCYPLWVLGGDRALIWATALAGALVVGLIYRSVRLAGGGALHLTLFMVPMLEAFQSRIRFRPDLVSLLFMAVLIEALLRWEPDPRRVGRFWAFLAALFCLWAQCHGGWAYGMALLGVWLLGLALDALREGRLSPRLMAALALSGLAPWAAVFLNPYTWQIPWFPVKSIIGFRDPSLAQVQEWQTTPFEGGFALFIVVGALILVLMLAAWRRLTWRALLAAGTQFALGIYWVRYVSFAVLALAPAAGERLRAWLRRPAVERAAWGAALLLALASAAHRFDRLQTHWDGSQKFPVQEVAFLRAHGVGGNLLNTYSSGGYLAWTAFPQCRIAMDGRYYPFIPVIGDYLKGQRSVSDYQAFLSKWPFEVVLYPYPDFHLREKGAPGGSPPRGPSPLLFTPDRWALVDFGDYGMVFLRREAKYQAVIRACEYRELRPDDLQYGVWAAAHGLLDRSGLEGEIRRKLREDALTRLGGSLRGALARLEDAHGAAAN